MFLIFVIGWTNEKVLKLKISTFTVSLNSYVIMHYHCTVMRSEFDEIFAQNLISLQNFKL